MFIMLSVLILFFGSPREAQPAPTCKPEVARVVSMQGIIEIRRTQENVWQQAGMEVVLCAGDMIRARSQSRAALRLSNNSMLRLDQKTSITFPAVQEKRGTSLLYLFECAIHIITRTPQPFKIRTPFVNASVEGTEFVVGLREDNAEVVVYEGKVSVSNELGSLLLHDHEAAVTYKGQAPRKEIIIRPADAVQWALYYPVILSYWQDGEDDSSALIRQASHLLTVGQADEAKGVIQQVLQLEPNNSNAHALLAIIALVQNEKDPALELASKAVTLDPGSAAGYLALSYTQQAHFEIDAALESLQKALSFDAQNALIWARLAELQMSMGYLERALDAAKLAVNLDPGLAKTQTVLGFAHLLQIDTQTAKDIFHRAIALDQADPTPRLGLGLALIREGELEAGRIELEIAASLDPANSLIRSYLGKAYFEEKRYPLASTQFDLAKERDPKDPTPWFYDAIQKQTQNRPVEALRDIQKSIELNNNRAVYRSKFLLDRDEAARGSSLARIFENLGFERRAIMETAKSLSFDPANHSAHRFLSDTYANTPRHEIARVSELLQAQLLQPINVNPVQPHMAVADLNIITGTGPSAAGFNEFAPLMERNKSQVVASGLVGNQGTLGNEVVLSKLYERTSISLGQFHYETNGFRPNYGQNHNIYNAFIQHAFTSKFNVQVELRKRETQHGDLILDGQYKRETKPCELETQPCDLDNFRKEFRQIINQDSARVGMRYELSPQQNIIASFLYTERKDNVIDPEPVTTKSKGTGYVAEVQHLFQRNNFNSITGFSTYRVDFKNQTVVSGDVFPDPSTISEKNKGYIYTNYTFLEKINVLLGFGYEAYKEETDHMKSKFNPKLGVQVDVTDYLRLRAAWFETVKSTLIANQTMEPTQVAGFNQLFDDVNGTKSRRQGIGLDTILSQNIYAGIEASVRNLELPGNPHKQREELFRTYIYWLPQNNWSIKGEPQLEKYSRRQESDLPNNEDPYRIVNMNLPVSVSYFHNNGLLTTLTGTYVLQNLKRPMNHQLTAGTHDFFMLDTSIGYRLPKRRGIINFEVRNLLDQEFIYRNFNFQVNEFRVSRYFPERTFLANITFNF